MGRVAAPKPGPLARAVSSEFRAELGRLNVSAMELGVRVGRSQNYLSRRLRDEMPFTVDDVEAICSALKLSYSALMRRAIEQMYATEGPDGEG